jgi:hypothetical protein
MAGKDENATMDVRLSSADLSRLPVVSGTIPAITTALAALRE